jgi:hypothetical protein
MHSRFIFWLAAAALALAGACTPASPQTTSSPGAVTLLMLVDQDQIFGYVQNASVGEATFSATEGIVGSRISCLIHLDDLTRFQQAELNGSLTLVNGDVVRDPSYEQDFVVETNGASPDTTIEFYIPQVLAVPVIVNFTLALSYEKEDVSHNLVSFEASLTYQFAVNAGTPASS